VGLDLETHRVLRGEQRRDQALRYSREEFLALRIEDLRPAEDIPALHRHLETMPSDTTPPDLAPSQEGRTLIEVETSGHGITFAGRRAEQVVINDVTERKQLEEQFRRRKRWRRWAVSRRSSA